MGNLDPAMISAHQVAGQRLGLALLPEHQRAEIQLYRLEREAELDASWIQAGVLSAEEVANMRFAHGRPGTAAYIQHSVDHIVGVDYCYVHSPEPGFVAVDIYHQPGARDAGFRYSVESALRNAVEAGARLQVTFTDAPHSGGPHTPGA